MIIQGFDSSKAWDYENAFYWFSPPSRILKMLAQYELYRMISQIPGDIFELGVYKGASLVRFATFREYFENDSSRRIVGFDAFGKFPRDSVSGAADLQFINGFEAEGGDGLSEVEVTELLREKEFRNIRLVAGNVFQTLPAYLEKNPATRIALLHLDMDVKEPTEFALQALYDRVVPGGIVVFDDYGVAGESDAADAFVARHGLRLQKLGHYSVPAFVVKPI